MNTTVVQARHGQFTVYEDDELVGLALRTYGEYSESEVEVFRRCLKPGDVAIDVGANIGSFTLPMAKLVGKHGEVFAFEASRANVDLLKRNISDNDLGNVTILPLAASDRCGRITVTSQDALHAYSRADINEGFFDIDAITIDSLNLPSCKFIKIDVDRHELQVLRGARETIKRCRPILFVENEHDDLKAELTAEIIDLGYRMYWFRPYQYNSGNFFKNERNLFGNIVSIMCLCVPDDAGYEVNELDEVADYRDDDEMFDREIVRYRKRVEKNLDDLTSRLMYAHYCNLMQYEHYALTAINANLRRDPQHQPTLAIKALLDLQRGNWKEGWPGYELRFGKKNRIQFGGERYHPVPKWNGEPTDEPLLIWSEQGFGDMIMFARFMINVLDRAPNAFLEVHPSLFELFDFSNVSPNGLYRLGRALPDYKLHCSLPSTAAALDVGEEEIHRFLPYLHADPLLVKNWQGEGNIRMGPTPLPFNGARIGLCASGSASSERPFTRDLPLLMVQQLNRRFGPVFQLNHQPNQFESFAATAACIKALELIITVDTSIAHLAGALGVPTWLLLSWDPDWRWGLKGTSTIWYPSIRIFRQPKFRDWQSVTDEVTAALEEQGF